jgi:ABC-type sugar transport system permease subunit
VTAAARPGPGFAAYLRDFARARSTLALVFCLPLIVIIGGLIIYPFFYSLYLSMLNKGQPVGGSRMPSVVRWYGSSGCV